MNTEFYKRCVISMVALSAISANAQNGSPETGVLSHLSVGLTAGTSGIGVDLSTPITSYLQIRAGFDYLPEISHKESVYYFVKGERKTTEVKGYLNLNSARLLLDVFPFRNSAFHLSTGIYVGSDEVIRAENTKAVTSFDKGEGLLIGNYIIGFDEDGFAKAVIKTNKFRPYVGIGFGRCVPRKRFGFGADLGFMLWGTPRVYEKQSGLELEVTKDHLGPESDKYFDILSKITVWPVLTLRFTGRIF